MELYEQILNGLTDSSCKLEDILLKLKILATRLKNDKLKSYINAELNGYNNIDELPDYRKIQGVLYGNVENACWRRTKTVLPTSHLKKKDRDLIETCYFLNKIAEIESYKDESSLSKPIAPELYGLLSEVFEYGYVTNAYVPISNAQIKGVLNGLRSTLIDLLMSLEEQFSQTEISSLFKTPTKEQLEKVNPIINQFFITSLGNSTQNTRIELENDK